MMASEPPHGHACVGRSCLSARSIYHTYPTTPQLLVSTPFLVLYIEIHVITRDITGGDWCFYPPRRVAYLLLLVYTHIICHQLIGIIHTAVMRHSCCVVAASPVYCPPPERSDCTRRKNSLSWPSHPMVVPVFFILFLQHFPSRRSFLFSY